MENEGGSEKKTIRRRKPPVDVRIVQTRELHRTLRVLIICTLIGVCVWKISDAVVDLMDKPPWLVALSTLLSVFGAAFAQTPTFWFVFYRVRKFTRETVSRRSEIEASIDPERTSSDLREDGTDPPGADL